METVRINNRVVRLIDSLNIVGTVFGLSSFGAVHIRWDDGTASIEPRHQLRLAQLAIVFGKSVYC